MTTAVQQAVAAELECLDLGRRAFGPTLEVQRRLVKLVQDQPAERAFLVLVEHEPPVITLGRGGRREHILATAEQLASSGVEVHQLDRGGDVTWHGPGQLVCYPITRVDLHGRDLRRFIWLLEEVVIRTLVRLGIEGERQVGAPGVWAGGNKVAAVGVAVRRWVSYHGLAVNVSSDLSGFDMIVPCGGSTGVPPVPARPTGETPVLRKVTSISRLLGREVAAEQVKPLLVECCQTVLGFGAARKVEPDEVDGRRKGGFRLQEGLQASGFRNKASGFRLQASGRASGFRLQASGRASGFRLQASGTTTATNPEARGPKSEAASLPEVRGPKPVFPAWLSKRIPTGPEAGQVGNILADLRLNTVCREARCPNLPECFARKTATFLILGSRCTRRCGFCAVAAGRPEPVRKNEPEAVAEACRRLGLRHVVITSVTRDDLPDGGAGHFARTILAVRARLPRAAVEVLTPDFRGSAEAVDTVLNARPDVLNHNVETVPRLYPTVRSQASYTRSLSVLSYARSAGPEAMLVKSGLMLGLGETPAEVEQVLRDLRAAGCDLVTVGQYLAPTPGHLPIHRFAEPAEFADYAALGRSMGFLRVSAGPFVRSSYLARETAAV